MIDQGWESPKHQYHVQSDKIVISKCKKDYAKSILKQTNHSLQPDMAMGWKPKLPSCPLPLSYSNTYVQQLIEHIPKDDRFKIVYAGKKYVNSVQVNQQYTYFWKYRQRYSLNLAIVQQAVKKIGDNNFRLFQQINQGVTLKQLKFDSSFQSGNLDMAVKVKPNQYDLFLRSDTNTKGHTNWYFFKVNNQKFLGNAQLNICNMKKTKTLYNKGMKPYIFQVNGNQSKILSPQEWSQNKAFDVCFVERYCRYGFDKKTFQLQFKYHFKKPNTQVYFAYGIPYTYSQLQEFINQISENHKQLVKCQKLCESLGGLNIPLIKISSQNFAKNLQDQSFSDLNMSKKISLEEQNSNQNKNKKVVLITGRVHPGQSNASYVLEGFIREILTNNQFSKRMRQAYVFYIIPMLNPDGVVAGNYRTSYSGKDLNRQFNKLNKFIYPEIFYLNELSLNLKQKYKKKLEFYFDFHGHSSKKNLFCYGPEYQPSNILFFKCRTFAKIIEQIHPIFSYRKSVFQISQHKKTTARAHMLWNVRIPMTFTFQISNGLYQSRDQKNIQLNFSSLIDAGKTIFKGFYRYISLETRHFANYNAKAKVDTGIRSRKFSSQKIMREKSLQIDRSRSNKQTIEMKERSLNKSIQELPRSDQFEKYIKQIKKQQVVASQAEGGSDSQSSEQDLSAQELYNLHQFVKERTKQSRQYNRKVYSFKIKPVKKDLKQRKISYQQIGEQNKENSQTQNIRTKIRSLSGIQSARRLYQMSQKVVGLKKPPLPIPPVYQKIVLCQKKFTVQF